MISLGPSGLHSGAGAPSGEGLEMWGERKEAASSEGQKRRGRAGGRERNNPAPPLAVAPQCVCEVFCKKLPGVPRCPVCLEVCWRHLWPALPLFCFGQKQPNSCQVRNLLLLSNGWEAPLRGPFRRESQITWQDPASQIYFYW